MPGPALLDLGGDAGVGRSPDAQACGLQRLLQLADGGLVPGGLLLQRAVRRARISARSWRSLPLNSLYFSALAACLPSTSRRCVISERRSLRRARFSRVPRMRDSVSLRRSLYLEIPAASSSHWRSSSGLAVIIVETMPCSMIAYWFLPQADAGTGR